VGADERIEWNDDLLTGVEPIDRQHRILIHTLGELESKRLGKGGARSFEEITSDLLAYAIYHFETEEELMKSCGYDRSECEQAERHLRQHREFSSKVVDLRAGLPKDEAASRRALVSYLKGWLDEHIRTTDQLLARFIMSRKSA
jgi:hemerythrin